MPVDGTQFRAVFGDVPTSVSVVTTVDAAGAPHGMTVGSLCGLSLEPPLLLFCVAHSAGSHARLCAAERYCISVLAQGQDLLARRFAERSSERFRTDLERFHGLPAAPRALAWLLCTRHQLLDAGDHTIVIAAIHETRTFNRAPMLYWRRGYGAVAASQAAA
jgi:flavin reductase ActVB